MRFSLTAHPIVAICLICSIIFLSGCESVSKKESAPLIYHKDQTSAIKFIANNLATQITPSSVSSAKHIPIDLFFNGHSAEEAVSSKAIQQQLIAELSASMPNGTFVPLNTKTIQNAQWVALASYTVAKSEQTGKSGNWVRLNVVLAEIKSGTSVAQASTYLDAKQFDGAPSRFYKDAPMYLSDASHQDRTDVIAGKKRSLGDRLQSRAELSEAIDAYESGKYADAENRFKKIVDVNSRDTAALSGLYQTLWSQNKKAEAERVFSQLASTGIEAGKLSVKILFKLGTTDFIDDGDIAQQYQLWLRAIAKTVADKKTCLDVTGHASASGASEYNEKLSLARANRISSRMQQLAPTIGRHMKAFGKGSLETIVGNMANDATDAIDRRVEFSVHSCD